jgi:fructose-specific phosphotransferase system IIC component
VSLLLADRHNLAGSNGTTMAIITCPDCFEQISHSAPTCIKCGHSFQVVRRGVVGKIMKNLFIWFNISLFLFVLWTFVFAGSIGISGDESSALASGMVATFGILSAMIIWFGGALFWGILVYITKGKLRKPLTPNEKREIKLSFGEDWS